MRCMLVLMLSTGSRLVIIVASKPCPFIIGGASLFGGRASLVRTLMGAALIAALNNGMVLMNINIDAQYIVKGVIILVAVVLERLASGARP